MAVFQPTGRLTSVQMLGSVRNRQLARIIRMELQKARAACGLRAVDMGPGRTGGGLPMV